MRDTGVGLTEDVRDAMGLLNSQVGYIYLLDPDCRIRWAGSGHAWAGEVDSLNAGIRKLVNEAKEPVPISRQVSTSTSTTSSRSPTKDNNRPPPPAEVPREGNLKELVDRALA